MVMEILRSHNLRILLEMKIGNDLGEGGQAHVLRAKDRTRVFPRGVGGLR